MAKAKTAAAAMDCEMNRVIFMDAEISFFVISVLAA
ncbi:MAG: hypothetical protein BWZ10_02516 [candidate division BRC1 bacterium ADurb.BinA364]|nr:MAG: hypothetical protein BWZ10_02516 [candidate division BRC1 bacterium ADurb.BinA364]